MIYSWIDKVRESMFIDFVREASTFEIFFMRSDFYWWN